jgi:hypothetical protein
VSLGTTIDFLTKCLVSLSIISYLSGLLISNFYLLKFGIARFDPSHAQYVASGLVWIILSLLCIFIVEINWRYRWPRFRDASTKRARWYEISLLPFGVAGSLWSLLLVLSLFRFNDTFFGPKVQLAVLAMIASALGDYFGFGLFRQDRAVALRQWASDNPATFLRALLLWLLPSMGVYSEFVYPHLPPMFGGPDHSIVTLVVKNQFALNALPKWVRRDGNLIGPLKIVSESDESVFAVEPSTPGFKPVLRIRHDQLDAIIYGSGR